MAWLDRLAARLHAGALITVVATAALAQSVAGDSVGSPVASVPVSNAPLKPFPFFDWSAAFTPQNTPLLLSSAHFPFWTGKALHDVEGHAFLVTLVHSGPGDFNEYLIKKSLQAQFRQAGAIQIASSRIPKSVLANIPEVDREALGPGLGDPYNDPVETWLIQRADRQIWIQYTDDSAEASLAVVETDP